MSDTIPQDVWDAWPKCAIPACQNKCCLRLNSKFCWPHTPGQMSDADLRQIERENDEHADIARDTKEG